MERYTVFTKTKVINNTLAVKENIIRWLSDNQIILLKPNEGESLHYAGSRYTDIVEEDWSGEVEFITQKRELRHVLNWDLGVDFFLPDRVVCPKCQKDLIKDIDPATFYGEDNKQQDPNEIKFISELAKGISAWNSGKEVSLNCHNCKRKTLIENYDYDNSLIFTNFAIIFWNWPELNDKFKNEFKQKLGEDILIETL
ncbi:hypothetical protein [Aquimarina sp. MMG016]|uniref:hypothetical protein n=1 Tax=Aquimarina sp. MMG016 TaxID=2822690 RepID=UPI001B39EB9C|nr:hypothetical protein [Aquimarina sp. MMG016]MBQ4822367.1 hypothetical protein [Aquimarina sp. MMG016]